jgi:hypothetical protein
MAGPKERPLFPLLLLLNSAAAPQPVAELPTLPTKRWRGRACRTEYSQSRRQRTLKVIEECGDSLTLAAHRLAGQRIGPSYKAHGSSPLLRPRTRFVKSTDRLEGFARAKQKAPTR